MTLQALLYDESNQKNEELEYWYTTKYDFSMKMDVSHSACFTVAFDIISKTEILFTRRQAFATYQTWLP